MYNWRVDLTDNTYKYYRLVEPPGPTDRPERRDTPFRTTTTLNLQPIRTLTCWVDEIPGSGGDVDTGKPSVRDATRLRGQADSPISHHNRWERATARPKCDIPSGVYDGCGERAPETPTEKRDDGSGVTQPKCDTLSGVYDGGGERVPETPPNSSDDRPIRSYTIRVDKLKQINKGLRDKRDKLKLCTAATQSQDSVATQPTTQ